MATDERAREIIAEAAHSQRARAEAEEWEAKRQHNRAWDRLDAARDRLHTATTTEEWDEYHEAFRAAEAAWGATDIALDRACWQRKRACWNEAKALRG